MAKLNLDDIMAPIDVIFKQRVAQLIAMGEKGVVLFAHYDASLLGVEGDGATTATTYKLSDFTSALNTGIENEALKAKVQAIFEGGASEVYLFEHGEALENYVEELNQLHFDWMVSDYAGDQATVATYCVEKEVFGLCYNVAKDNMTVVNFTNPSVTLKDGTEVQALDFLPTVVGVCAGCPYDKSISYKVL